MRGGGGWTAFQFAERRIPTLAEINAVSPETPVFVLHLYDRALLNQAALRAADDTKDTPDPPDGEMQRDRHGNPTGLLIAKPLDLIPMPHPQPASLRGSGEGHRGTIGADPRAMRTGNPLAPIWRGVLRYTLYFLSVRVAIAAIALVGEGAMQMLGNNFLITVARHQPAAGRSSYVSTADKPLVS